MRNITSIKKALITIFAVVLIGWNVSSIFARGGGGCLMQGTPVLTPSGVLPIESLKQGDPVLGVIDNTIIPATIQSVIRTFPHDIYEIVVDDLTLRVTADHPIETRPGIFRIASSLKPGDTVVLEGRNGFKRGFIESIKRMLVTKPAYNLLVAPAGTYIAGGFVVHNKGCFLPETLIRRADGTETWISQVRRHDTLLAFTPDGKIVKTSVRKIITYEANEYCKVEAGNTVLHVTKEHPFYVGSGEFKTLEALKLGDNIAVFDGVGLSLQQIKNIETVHTKTLVYNIQTDAPHTFFASGAAVHNKGGGCFPAGTMIKTPKGEAPIDRLRAGDTIIAVDKNGQPVTARIIETHATKSPLQIIKTGHGLLKTTQEHPLALASGGFRPAGELSIGDRILTWNDTQCTADSVTDKSYTGMPETVYNLTVDWPHTFVADGVIVHNKGGGGHSGGYHGGAGGHGGSRSDNTDGVIPFALFCLIAAGFICVFIAAARKGARRRNLDFVFGRQQVLKKSEKTMKLIAFIARQDPSLAPDGLVKTVRSTFLKLQQCWQAREYSPMKPLMMPDLYQAHLLEIEGMIRNHEINIIAALKIDQIDLVNVRYTIKEEEREFTALITATAQDYYVDDRTQARLRGDEKPAQFQEFWTFHYLNKSWLLREIEQTRESGILKEDNFFEQVTDKGTGQIYGDSASKEGPVGPWVEKESEAKDTRIERMLNFLSQTDKIWDRNAMLLTARQVFLELMKVWESGDAAAIPVNDLFPDFADSLKNEIIKNRDQGITMEFRNLCIRKVELVLVKNYADNTKDEYVSRVRAHAQKIMSIRGKMLHQDDDVTPFEQFLTLGRYDNRWKLKEIVSSGTAQGFLKQENIDQESTPQQLKWYYQHKRAV